MGTLFPVFLSFVSKKASATRYEVLPNRSQSEDRGTRRKVMTVTPQKLH